jgi:gamma-glutamyltranspeptidase/glutathione hydrolase
MLTYADDGSLYGPFGVMGGFMQPQGHVQVVLNIDANRMTSQEALDHPRFCIETGTAGGAVALEEGIPLEIMARLSEMGHSVRPVAGQSRATFGRGQIIVRDRETGVLAGGSDPRADGQAVGY